MLNSEVIGQQDIWNRLMEMVQENRVPHALMFCGPQGCGKLAVALAEKMGASRPAFHLPYHQDIPDERRPYARKSRFYERMA